MFSMHWTKALPWVPFHSPPSSACLQSHPSPLTRSALWSFFFLFSFSLFSLELTFDTKSVMSFLLSFHFWNSKNWNLSSFHNFLCSSPTSLAALPVWHSDSARNWKINSCQQNQLKPTKIFIIWKRLNFWIEPFAEKLNFWLEPVFKMI